MCDEGQRLLMQYAVAKVLNPKDAAAAWDRVMAHFEHCHGCSALLLAALVERAPQQQDSAR